MSSLIVSFIESSNHCILASSLLVLVWFFSLWVLELMVMLMTSSSSSKTEFTRIFYDVFDVGGYAGSSQLEVSLLYLLAYLPCLLGWCYSSSSIQQAWVCSIRSSFAEVMEVLVFLGVYLFSWTWHKVGASGSTAGVSGSTAYKRYYRPKVHVLLLLFPVSSAWAVVPLMER